MLEKIQSLSLSKFEWSLVIILLAILFKNIFSAIILKNESYNRDRKRKTVLNFNAFTLFVTVFFLISLWNDELRNLALSLVAIGVAVVVATKELILCFLGGVYRATSGMFHLGDRIEVNGIRGDVIDRGLFSTRLLEIGPGQRTHQYTGRSITVPNSLFLSHNVQNESFTKNYVLHTFVVPLNVKANWSKASKILLEQAHLAYTPYKEEAERYIDYVQKKAHLQTPGLEPRVHIRFCKVNELELNVRVTVPAHEKGKIEQQIVRGFLESFQEWES